MAFYESALGFLAAADGAFGGVAAVSDALCRAYGRALQASAYLYGVFRQQGVA